MSQYTVAICIPTYNQAEYLVGAVESAYAQTYPNVEVWVADDCSTDTTPQAIQLLLERYPDLHYHRQEHNLGISENSNWLLAQPKTDFVVRLDSDDFLHSSYVENLVLLLDRYPLAGYAHCAVQTVDKSGKHLRVRRLGGRGEFQSAEAALHASVTGYRVAANICMFRTSVLHELNFYRPEVQYAQDWDFSVLVADAGWGNVYSTKIMASYRLWEDDGKVRPKRKKIEVEGCIQIFEQSIMPSFAKRGWSISPIAKSRRNMALSYATVLDSPIFTSQEKAELVSLLRRLDSSFALRLRCFLMRSGLGPLLRLKQRSFVMLKDVVKRVLLVVSSKIQR